MNFNDLIVGFVQSNIPSILLVLAVLILIFFLVREILCWYWKLNEIVDLLKENNQYAKDSNDILERAFPTVVKSADVASETPKTPIA